jgi:hypothetical protein
MPPESSLETLYNETYPGAPKKYQKYLTTAQYIENYVRTQANFEALTTDLSEHGTVFLEGQEAPGLGTLLYAELTLKAYLRDASSPQQGREHLKAMATCLHDLYNKPTTDTQKKLTALLENTAAWLTEIKKNTTADPQQITDLCASLYTVLTITSENLKQQNNPEGKTKMWLIGVKLDLNKKIEQTDEILTQITALASQLNSPPKAQTPEAQDKNKDKFDQGMEHLKALLTLRKQYPNLTGDLEAAQTILDALDNNEKKVTNRDYALTLIQDNQAAFDTLLEHAPEAEKQAWDKRMQALTHPDPMQQTTNAALFALSYAAAPTNYLYRAFTPQETQDFVKQHTLTTPDSDAKDQLRALAKARVVELTSAQHQFQKLAQDFESTQEPTENDDDLDKKPTLDKTIQELEALYHDGCKAQDLKNQAQNFTSQKETKEKQKKQTPKPKLFDNLRNFLFKTYVGRHKILETLKKHVSSKYKNRKKSFSQLKQSINKLRFSAPKKAPKTPKTPKTPKKPYSHRP